MQAGTGSSPLAMLVADDLPNGILMVEDGGGVIGANRAMLEMLECDAQWLIGRPVSTVLTRPAAMLYHASVYIRLRGQARVDEVYLDFRSKTGQNVPVLCSARMREHESRVVVVISATHMTERRRIHEDLLRTRRITEQIPGVVYQYLRRADGTDCIPYASEALRQLFGVSPIQVQTSAELISAAVHPEDVGAYAATILESERSLQTWRHQFRARRGEEPWRWLEGHATPERLPDGATLWHGFVQDVTERKAAEDSMLARQAADRANQAKSEFLARVSHELRTPLNAILGFAQILSMDKTHPLELLQQRRVAHIEDAGRDLLCLIDEVLDITRIESGAVGLVPSWVNIKALLTRVTRLVEGPARERGVQLRVQVDKCPSVFADPARLGQVLTNLLSNAVKYTEECGCVTASCSLENDKVSIAIHDSGPGMSEDQIDHLFEPFNRLGAERTGVQGTGLGLVIVKRLVEAMDGSVVVSSSPGHGCTFRVILPHHPHLEAVEAVRSPRPAPLAPCEPAVQRSRVLYVEDDPVNALVMQAICELRPGLVLHVESTGRAAIEWARQHPVDLVLLDMNLPDIDGLHLVQDLRLACEQPALHAIAVSADAMPECLERARLAGFSQYWTKPLNVRETLDKLDAALGRTQSSRSSEVT